MSSIIKFSTQKPEPVDYEVFILDIHSLSRDGTDPETFPQGSGLQDEVEQVQEVDPREEAEREARGIMIDAQTQANQIKTQAYEEGLAKGRAAGEAEWLDAMERVAELAGQLNERTDSFLASLEPQVVKLSVEIAEKIIRHEVTMKPETVMDMIRAGLRQLKDKESVKVRINPADMEIVKQKRADIIAAFDGIQNLEIVDDRRVDRGGCMIDSPGGVLDARIRTQIREVERVLTEAAVENAGTGDAGSE